MFMDAKKAHWLIGSDIPGVMTAVSKLAFLTMDDAKKYQQKHGGTIGTFDDAMNRTLSDMGSDRKMIMARVAERAKMGKDLAGKHGCYQCHGEEGRGGSASGWNTPAFLKKMDNRVKIKEAITKGGSGMQGYEEKIDEKDLHSITLYIWSLRPMK
jgi:mono/diheme cytochrome c family protein